MPEFPVVSKLTQLQINTVAQWHQEPVIRHIYGLLAADEARHAGAYLRYMKRAIENFGDMARLAFTRIGVLMANTRTSRPLHPTNLHVNKTLFPQDTVQSRLPDPDWLERWLDQQIDFDASWEDKVSATILRKLSGLLGRDFATVRDLSRYRRALENAAPGAG